jgi:CBS domain-containing protein
MAAETTKKRKIDPAIAKSQNLPSSQSQSTRRPDFTVSGDFLVLLSKSRPSDVLLGHLELITCTRTDPISEVLQKLQNNRLTSLPVLTSTNTYYGFIDMVDIMRFVIDLIGEEQMEQSDWDIEKLPIYRKATVKDVMKYPLSRTNPWRTVKENDSLMTVCEIMAKGAHRVGVLNGKNELVQVVSQSAMIKWIYNNIGSLGVKGTMPVKYFDSANQYVISAFHDEKAVDAFKVLKVCRVTGIALLNDDGTLMGSLSSSDLKKIHSSTKWISRLFQPVSTFVQYYARGKKEPLSVNGDHTVVQVLKKFVKNKVHRLFVIDEKNEPVGVISMTDMIKTLLEPV